MDREIETGDTGRVLGNTTKVEFVTFGMRTAEGKVDTGATTSSLHATNISIDKASNQVSFNSDVLSSNRVTLDLAGVQEVHSADGGGQPRPIVQLDVTIDGVPIKRASFNLNDRSHMDSKILIGQNILKPGNFTIDPNKGAEQAPLPASMPRPRNEAEILKAIEVLAENNITVGELITYMRTVAVNRITE